MQIRLVITEIEDEESIAVSLDSSSTISSWLIDHYFTEIYSKQMAHSKQSVQPKNIIGFHDMFIIQQILQSSSSELEFNQLCQKKIRNVQNDSTLEIYQTYLNRCGLIDIIDLFHQCRFRTFSCELENVKNTIDRLFFNYFLEIALEHFIDDEKTSNKESIMKLFDPETKPIEQTITKNYVKHTLCTYLSLLLDTRNEHALIHCLATPVRAGIERRTIVELRRLTKLSKNECLTIYQILLSFLRRKELILSRASGSSSSQSEAVENEDPSFVILDKYYNGIKEFFDFIEQLQMIIEENEHLKIQSIDTFRQLMTLLSKQLRKDVSFNRCETIIKETIEEFCQCFQSTLTLMSCPSPVRSASSGGTLAGRRFLRSVAYLCAKQTIHLPILLTKNDHYDSPSTGLRKATSSSLLRSPLTPLPMVLDPVPEKAVEEKVVDIPTESVFMWQKKSTDENSGSKSKRLHRKKSQRCLDLSTIEEQTTLDTNENSSSQSTSSSSTRQPLGEIDEKSLSQSDRQSQTNISFAVENEIDKENLSIPTKKRTLVTANPQPPQKKQKKTSPKVLITGQKMITTFFQSKT